MEIEESDADIIDNHSLGSFSPDYLKDDNIHQLNEFIDKSIYNDDFENNSILSSVINQSTNDNTRLESLKLLKHGARTINNLSKYI